MCHLVFYAYGSPVCSYDVKSAGTTLDKCLFLWRAQKMISIWEMILGLGFKALLSGQTASAIRREHQKGHYNHACDIWLLHIPSSHLKC